MLGPTMLRPFAWALMNTSRVATQNMRTVVEETLEWLGKNFYIKITLYALSTHNHQTSRLCKIIFMASECATNFTNYDYMYFSYSGNDYAQLDIRTTFV